MRSACMVILCLWCAVITLAADDMAPASSLISRVRKPPAAVLAQLKAQDKRQDYTAYQPTAAE